MTVRRLNLICQVIKIFTEIKGWMIANVTGMITKKVTEPVISKLTEVTNELNDCTEMGETAAAELRNEVVQNHPQTSQLTAKEEVQNNLMNRPTAKLTSNQQARVERELRPKGRN